MVASKETGLDVNAEKSKYVVMTRGQNAGQNVKNIYIYTGCHRRKGPNFGRVFFRSNYTDITQNTYIQSSMVTEILNIEN